VLRIRNEVFNLVPVRALLDADFASFPTDDSVARYLCLKHRGAHKFDKIFRDSTLLPRELLMWRLALPSARDGTRIRQPLLLG